MIFGLDGVQMFSDFRIIYQDKRLPLGHDHDHGHTGPSCQLVREIWSHQKIQKNHASPLNAVYNLAFVLRLHCETNPGVAAVMQAVSRLRWWSSMLAFRAFAA